MRFAQPRMPFRRLQKPVSAARLKAGFSCNKPNKNCPYGRNPLKVKKRSLFEASLLLSYVKDNTYAACRQKTICRSHSREAELMQRHKAFDVN